MRKRVLFLLGLILLMLLMLADISTAQPKVFMSETSWDLGIIPQGGVISHTYWIKNIGTDTLRILKVRPG
ncbi:MAG: DUF1573 domain-containing protein [candidate division Zixibacteria bacterium]|nr:DUF1573 domain-containing protein [candidate division Zixibacteria bacterium]